jgi:hypothetical protein
MFVIYHCPGCQQHQTLDSSQSPEALHCSACDWGRRISPAELAQDPPQRCLVCGCEDLWRQKDFPQKLGLAFVALGAGLSTLFWAWYMPAAALGVLLVFAFADLLLYTCMRDVLVCYRCSARYRQTSFAPETTHFNLDVAERYRQEASRLKEASEASGPADRGRAGTK